MNDASDDKINATPEAFPPAGADRLPSPDEEAAAEQAAKDVDVAEVAAHYEEMTELGKEVRGEGEITPR
jgi:hypothetical protein